MLALAAAGLVGGELYARHRGATVVEATLKCALKDDVTVSFGAFPPFLWQYATKHYGNVSITSAGNQIGDLKGMKVDIAIDDARPSRAPHAPRERSARSTSRPPGRPTA